MKQKKEAAFWDHLDELRKVLFRMLIAVVLVMIVAFLNKDLLFRFILAPSHSDFIIYRLFCKLGDLLSFPFLCPESFNVELINTQLTSQFLIHMSTAFYAGILITFPYILYQLFRFVSPALYENERNYIGKVLVCSCFLFWFGVLLNYFLIFPLSFRFLATYQVNAEVVNMINLSSYVNTLMMLSLMIGVMSELPVLSWLFSKLGFITDTFMKKHRKHAVVLILVLSAIITPTADLFTLLLVFFPIYFLYEVSIVIVKSTVSKKKKLASSTAEEDWDSPY